VKVLVTGHHGYISSVVAPLLAAHGDEVTGVDTFFYRGCDLRPGPQVESVQRDIRELGEADLAGYEAVVHPGSLSNDPLGQPRADLRDQRASEHPPRTGGAGGRCRPLLFASSCSMYGGLGEDPSL